MDKLLKKKLITAVVFACALVFICSIKIIGIGDALSMGRKPAESLTPISVGAILPLTGNSAFLGQDEKKVLDLIQKTHHPNGRSVKIRIEDNKSTQKDSVSAYYKLRNEGISAFILSLTRSVEAVAPIGTTDKSIMMGLSMSPKIAERSDFLFRVYYGTEAQLDKLIEYMKKRGFKRLAVLYIETPEMSATYIDVLPEIIKSRKLDINIVATESFSFSGKEIKSAMAKIADKKPDVIIIEDYGSLYSQILEAASIYGVSDKLLGGIGFTAIPPQQIKMFEGIPFLLPKEMIYPTKEYQEMLSRFESEYGAKPLVGIDVLYTYYAAILLTDSLANLNDTDLSSERLKSEIRKVANKKNLRVQPDGTFYFEAALAKYIGNTIVEVK